MDYGFNRNDDQFPVESFGLGFNNHFFMQGGIDAKIYGFSLFDLFSGFCTIMFVCESG